VLYEVRVEGEGSFEFERDEPLEVGDYFTQFTMTYEVRDLLPGHDQFDAVIVAAERGGPG
jgi:hypothetical protein